MQLLQECPLKLTRLEFCIKASTPVTLIYYIEKMQIVNVQKYPKAAVNMQIKFPYCPLDSRGNWQRARNRGILCHFNWNLSRFQPSLISSIQTLPAKILGSFLIFTKGHKDIRRFRRLYQALLLFHRTCMYSPTHICICEVSIQNLAVIFIWAASYTNKFLPIQLVIPLLTSVIVCVFACEIQQDLWDFLHFLYFQVQLRIFSVCVSMELNGFW